MSLLHRLQIDKPLESWRNEVIAGVDSPVGAPMSDVTGLLEAIGRGEPERARELVPIVYEELRRLAMAWLAHEHTGQTLQATALVHEAYLRLVGSPAPYGRARQRSRAV
jgi:hypothetical protein